MRVLRTLITVVLLTKASMLYGSQRIGVEKYTIEVDGHNRSYLVHVPPCRRAGGLALVVMLHGRGASALSASEDFGWIGKSDQECFVAVFPQALPIDPARLPGAELPNDLLRGWTVGTNDTLWWTHLLAENIRYIANPKYPPIIHPLDTTFLEALLGQVLRRYGADAQHIYVVGFSSGAWMASDLAQFAQRRIAAVAIVGYVGMSRPHRISYPVSSFLIFGKQDFSGSPSPAQWSAMPPIAKEKWYGQDTLPTLDEDLRAWAQVDGCISSKVTATPWGNRVDWTRCRDRVRVRGLSVDGLGHEWPGSKQSRWNTMRPTGPALRLTDEIWNFLSATN